MKTFLKLDLNTIKQADFLELSVADRVILKEETKKVAALVRAAGYEVFSTGFGCIVMRLKPTDVGTTLVPFYEARALLSK
jgi:hypothetical protein